METESSFPNVIEKTVQQIKKSQKCSIYEIEHIARIAAFSKLPKSTLQSESGIVTKGNGENIKFINGMYVHETNDVHFKHDNGTLIAVKCPKTESSVDFCKQHKIQFLHLF
jgi:hypothetical protein